MKIYKISLKISIVALIATNLQAILAQQTLIKANYHYDSEQAEFKGKVDFTFFK